MTIANQPLTATRPLTGRAVLVMLVAFFAAIIAVNVVMVYLALNSMPGTVVRSAYKVGNAYNTEIAAARAQEELGWRASLHTAYIAPDRSLSLAVALTDRDQKPLGMVDVDAVLLRPAEGRVILRKPMTRTGAADFAVRLDDIGPGQWELTIDASEAGERRYRSVHRLNLR